MVNTRKFIYLYKTVASKDRTYLILTPKRLVEKNRTLYGLPGKYIVQPNTTHL
jgi:hypothetical protein